MVDKLCSRPEGLDCNPIARIRLQSALRIEASSSTMNTIPFRSAQIASNGMAAHPRLASRTACDGRRRRKSKCVPDAKHCPSPPDFAILCSNLENVRSRSAYADSNARDPSQGESPMMRLFLFLATNFAVLLVMSVTLRQLRMDRFLYASRLTSARC